MLRIDRPHWSYSRLNQLLRICPLQYAFQRIHRLTPECVTESLPFGSAIHQTAESLWASRLAGRDCTDEELAGRFADLWTREVQETPDLQYRKGDFESLLSQGQDLIRVYRRAFPENIEILDYNVPFQVPLIDRNGELLETPLVGEIDLLVRHGDRVCAVDLKTAAQRYGESRMAGDLQPTVYLYALRTLGHDAFFRWDVLLKHKTPQLVQYPAERTSDDFHRLVDLIRAAEALIDSGVFIPNEGSYFCGGCGFRSACRDWSFERVQAPRAGSQMCEPDRSPPLPREGDACRDHDSSEGQSGPAAQGRPALYRYP